MITLILLSGESLEISFEHETHVCYYQCRNILGEIPLNILVRPTYTSMIGLPLLGGILFSTPATKPTTSTRIHTCPLVQVHS